MKGWENITLENLIALIQTSGDSTLTAIDKQVKVLSIVTGKSEDELLDLSKVEFLRLSKEYNFITELPTDKQVKDFKCAGYHWSAQKDISKISTSDYINLSELIKDKDKLVDNIPAMLAIFCTPYKKYLFIKIKSKVDHTDKVELLKKAKASDVYPLSLFFCRVLIYLTKDIGIYLEEQIQTMTKNLKNQTHSLSNGVGT